MQSRTLEAPIQTRMSGDSHSRISADDLHLFAAAGSGGVEEPEPQREDEWSADAPPLPFMNPASPDGAPSDRLHGALPWIKRAG